MTPVRNWAFYLCLPPYVLCTSSQEVCGFEWESDRKFIRNWKFNKKHRGEKVTSLSPFDICRYFHIKLYTVIICNYFLDPMYLLYVAIICIVPALVLPVADVSSIVPKHCITRVHDHCVQGVPALILEEKQINNQSIHKQKMQYSRKKNSDVPVQSFRRTHVGDSGRNQRFLGKEPCSQVCVWNRGCSEIASGSCTRYEAVRGVWHPEQNKWVNVSSWLCWQICFTHPLSSTHPTQPFKYVFLSSKIFLLDWSNEEK